jgi:leucyl-tRNA synthetase
MVLAEDARKMSKSFGNVINPDDIVKNFGADTLRMYEMFMGPFEQAINWSNQGVVGVFRFLNRVFNLKSQILPPCGGTPPKAVANPKFQTPKESAKADPTGQANPKSKIQNSKIETLLHGSIKKISEDLENMKFNTAVSQLMIFVNELEKESSIDIEIYKTFLKLLAPFAPHLAEELWHLAGEKKSIHLEKWPAYDPEKIKEEIFELVIQVNGKVRATVSAPIDITEERAKELALSQERIKSFLSGKTPRKVIFIPHRLINIVV